LDDYTIRDAEITLRTLLFLEGSLTNAVRGKDPCTQLREPVLSGPQRRLWVTVIALMPISVLGGKTKGLSLLAGVAGFCNFCTAIPRLLEWHAHRGGTVGDCLAAVAALRAWAAFALVGWLRFRRLAVLNAPAFGPCAATVRPFGVPFVAPSNANHVRDMMKACPAVWILFHPPPVWRWRWSEVGAMWTTGYGQLPAGR